jgi:hypothetical protein
VAVAGHLVGSAAEKLAQEAVCGVAIEAWMPQQA